ELAKATPMVIDYETRMDRILVTGEKTVTCYYTLLNVTKEEVDTAEFVRMMRPGLLDRYNQHPALEWFRDRNIQIQHAYYGRDAQWVATIQVPADVEK
ncbi:MAG: hypothetical protein JEZ10_00345, partial [Verrucomicrobia bacterium]|nr:hypothetical protein [Verrucomicrobiota bacterium]